MTIRKSRVAILFPADQTLKIATSLEKSRFAEMALALEAAGLDVVSAPFSNDILNETRERLLGVDGVLVWFNPNEGGRDRTMLNALLRDVASQNAFVSTHPDVIDRIGTKDILFQTKDMGWGCDTRLYNSVEQMQAGLVIGLKQGAPRVLKQMRGQSGDGVWLVKREKASSSPSQPISAESLLSIREAKRGSPEERMSLEAFLQRCKAYFNSAGGMIDQEYQARLPEGMVRCYLVRDRVVGFGEQLINMLYPAPPGMPSDQAPLPGQRLYFPPTRADFQRLKQKLETEWVDQLCAISGVKKSQLPVLWDADFLYGPKDANGEDTYVLCEINVSSVYPFPPSALAPMVAETVMRLKAAG